MNTRHLVENTGSYTGLLSRDDSSGSPKCTKSSVHKVHKKSEQNFEVNIFMAKYTRQQFNHVSIAHLCEN